MTPATLETYEAPSGGFADQEPVKDPTTQWAAAGVNRLLNDTAQLTRVAPRAILKFTTGSGATGTAIGTRTMWGDTSGFYPTTITRSGAGVYVVTYPSTFANELSESESISFFDAHGKVTSTTEYGVVQCTASGAVINVKVVDMAGTPTDFTAGVTTITLFLY